ncbi:MAG: HAD family hydrolase [Phycisphaerae bacterium]|jgi:phosphonatase-like hydrolase
MPLELFVFDMAGTTVDDAGDHVAAALVSVLEQAGVHATAREVDPVMGIPKPLAIRELLRHARGCMPDPDEVHAVHAEFQAAMVDFYRIDPSVREIPGASGLFRRLRDAGVRVTLDTGFDRLIVDAIIERLGWSGLVDDSIASDEVDRGRPEPDMIRALMRRAGVTDPVRVGKLGDSVSDIDEGLNAGCGFVGAIVNGRTSPFLASYPSVVPVRSLEALPEAMAAAGFVLPAAEAD